jgi:hypothetical protein
MSRLSRYRRGSLVPHLIVLALIPTAGFFGAAGEGDALAIAHAAAPFAGVDTTRPAVSSVAGVDTTIVPGTRTFLEPNFPNPLSNQTTFAFSLAEEMPVTLKVYDFFYNEVATLIDNVTLPAGRHLKLINFGRDTSVQPLFSGMYFYELRAGGEIYMRRMLVIK